MNFADVNFVDIKDLKVFLHHATLCFRQTYLFLVSGRGCGRLSPEDAVALAQSPPPEFLQESFAGSLLILEGNYKKVKPERFIDLPKLSRQPSALHISPPTSSCTPRLVKEIGRRIGYTKMERYVFSSQDMKRIRFLCG